MGKRRNIAIEAAERFGLLHVKRHVLERRVPASPWYQGDGASLALLLLVQVLTGIFLTPEYSNSINEAYDSVRFISEELPLGWLLRGLHYWSAGMMVIMVVFHLFRQILVGGYKAPREGTWTVGVFLFFLVITMSYTGYVLRWDERAVYAVRVVLNIFHNVPLIGDWLVRFVQGGSEIGATTLTRFFSIHVIFIPLLLIGLVAFHIYLVIVHGVTSRIEREIPVANVDEHKRLYKRAAHSESGGQWFHPTVMAQSGMMAFVVFLLAFLLALFVGPANLFPEANLVNTTIPREEWWFWWYSSLIALLPPALAPIFQVTFPVVLFFLLLSLPLIDRRPARGIRNRPVWATVVVICVIALVSLSALRVQSPWTGWPQEQPPEAPAGVMLSEGLDRGRHLFAKFGCNSCHAVSGRGPRVGPDFAEMKRRLSRDEIRNYILEPPVGVAMPAYKHRLTKEELELIVEYVLAAQTFPRR